MIAPTHDSIAARLSRVLHPGLSYCLRCGRSWGSVAGHDTPFNRTQSCFPLCESCWASLDPEGREPYYWSLLREWEEPSEHIIYCVIAAVRAGR